MKLSIITINYKTPQLTSDSILSIKNSIKSVKYEIIVVDNDSGDDSVSVIRENHNDIKIISNNKNYGYGKAVNLGVNEARGEYLLILNSDIFIKDDYIDNLISFYEEKNAGLLGVKLLLPNGKIQRSFSYFPEPLSIISVQTNLLQKIKKKPFARYGNIDFKNAETQQVDWVTGAFMLLSKKNFNKINGFDENFFMYFEDVDLCRKLSEAELPTYYISEYSAVHNHSASVKSLSRSKFNFYKVKEFESSLYYLGKYYNKSVARTKFILLFILYYKLLVISAKYYLLIGTKKTEKNKWKVETVKEKIKRIQSKGSR